MKSQLFRASTTLSMLVMLVAAGLPGAAQQPPVRRLPAETQERKVVTEQRQERPIIELSAQEVSPEAARVAVPRECERIRPEVQTHDTPDKFTPPGSPVSLSPSLTSLLASRNQTPKAYDDPRINMVFADSFRLRSCRVCYATLEVGVRHDQDLWTNDTITAGSAPFNPPGVLFLYSQLWNPAGANPKTVTFALSTAAMNQYLMTGPMPPLLDLIAQDDTNFDYATLSVWYY